MAKVNVQKWAQAGIVFGILGAVISWLYSIFSPNGIANISFAMADIDVASKLQQGIDTSLGAKILGPLSGILPQIGWFSALLLVAVSGLVVFVFGRYLYEWIPVRARTKQGKLMYVALWGSLAVGMILSLMGGTIADMMSWSFLWITVATAIAFLITALIYVYVLNRFMPKIAIIPE